MIIRDSNISYGVGIVLWLCSIIYILVFPSQSDFEMLALGFPLAFLTYFFFIWSNPAGKKISYLILAGLLARIVAIFFFPELSDDIYRFVWDGRITHNGMQPYAYLPIDIVQQVPSLAEGNILAKMNSPEYFTVYPPVSQFIFYLSSWIGLSVEFSSVLMKIFFFLAECLTLFFAVKILRHLKIVMSSILIYWLNPLIIIEGIGNLHFEIIMIAFLSASIYYWTIGKKYWAMIFLALSVGSKLLSLLILPYLLWQIRWKQGIKVLAVFMLALLVVFLPLILGLNYGEFLSSIDLYFRKFEFNAGIYYLLRWIGFQLSGYNLITYIGPILGMLFICLTLYLTIKEKTKSLFAYLFVIILLYLLFATTVHPWYLSIPIFCSVFIRSRMAILWSSLIWLTYINYSYEVYNENLAVVATEYFLLLLYLVYEWKNVPNALVLNNEVIKPNV